MSTETLEKPKAKAVRAPALPDPRKTAKIGQTVLWYRHMDRGLPPTPAVIQEGGSRVHLVVGLSLLSGVPHASDPIVEHLQQVNETDLGFWEHTDDTLWLIQLRESVEKAKQ